MKRYIEEWAIELGNYIVENEATVRDAAMVFGISKSTVHKDVAKRLYYIDPSLFFEVRKVLEVNKATRHLRGGEATRIKYKKQRESK